MDKKLTLLNRFEYIKDKFGDNASIYFEDVQKLFPELKKSSVYWLLSKLVDEGYLKRIRNGIYSFNEYKGKLAVYLSKASQRIQEILDETGYKYYISGLDVIQKFLHHVPEEYPSMVFVDKDASEEIRELLLNQDFYIIDYKKSETSISRNKFDNRSQIFLYPTTSFDFQEKGIAVIEKAFIDLFYSITRENFPFAIQELVRTYSNMIKHGIIDQKKMVKISYVRNMQYDIRFIVESRFITENAFEFVELLKKEV